MSAKRIPPAVQPEPGEVLPRSIHLVPLDRIAGFEVRPGFYEINGATAIPGGVNFTVHSHGASSIAVSYTHLRAHETSV